jgi:hypothetical protein
MGRLFLPVWRDGPRRPPRYGLRMTTATILSWVLAAAPETSTDKVPRAAFDVADVELEQTATTAQLTAFDSDGETVAELVVWRDSVGQPLLAATFSDGLYMFVSLDGEAATIDSNDPAAVSERIAVVEDVLAATTTGANRWVCAGEILAAAFTCGTIGGPAGAAACALGAGLVACACIPLIAKDVPDDAECFE